MKNAVPAYKVKVDYVYLNYSLLNFNTLLLLLSPIRSFHYCHLCPVAFYVLKITLSLKTLKLGITVQSARREFPWLGE